MFLQHFAAWWLLCHPWLLAAAGHSHFLLTALTSAGKSSWSFEKFQSRGGGIGGRGWWRLWLLTWRCSCSNEIASQQLHWRLHIGQLIPSFLVLAMFHVKLENLSRVILLAAELGLSYASESGVQIGGEWIGQRLKEQWEAQASGNFIGDMISLLERNCITGMFQWICLTPRWQWIWRVNS